MVIGLIFILSFYQICYASESSISPRGDILAEWHAEVKKSLGGNIHGNCKVSSAKANIPSDITVTLNFPSKKEVANYRKRPNSISKGNDRLLYIINATRLHSFFFQETGPRWMFPDDHPGQSRERCYNVTRALGEGKATNTFYTDFYKYPIERVTYLLKGKNAFISDTGTVWFGCGHFQGKEGCETRWDHVANDWINRCEKVMKKQDKSFPQMMSLVTDSSYSSPGNVELINACCFNNTAAKAFKRVFVITAGIDFNFHHLIADQLARITRYLPFLRSNPDVMVHVREWETVEPGYRRQDYEIHLSRKCRESLLELLGIDKSRLVSRSVTAERVYIPRATSCSDSVRNPTEVRLLASEFIKSSYEKVYERKKLKKTYEPSTFMMTEEKKPVVLHHQVDDHANYEKTLQRKNLVLLIRKSHGWGSRFWNEKQANEMISELGSQFPDHNIVTHYADSTLHPDFCYACEIIEMTTADILIGMHGAGLTKQMFMPSGGIVFEISAHFNDAQMPLCGYYGNWAHIFGHHHYLYAYNGENGSYEPPRGVEHLDPVDIAKELSKYYKYIHSDESEHLRKPLRFSSSTKSLDS